MSPAPAHVPLDPSHPSTAATPHRPHAALDPAMRGWPRTLVEAARPHASKHRRLTRD